MKIQCGASTMAGSKKCRASADRYWEGWGPPIPPGGPGKSTVLIPYCHGHSWEEPTTSGRGRWLDRTHEIDVRYSIQEILSE